MKQAFRTLTKRPGFSIAAVLTLALGIGPTTAIVSIGNALLLRPLPYPGADRIVALWQADRTSPTEELGGSISHPNQRDVRREVVSLAASAQYRRTNPALTGLGAAELTDAAEVTPGFFRVFGTGLLAGRDFTDADDVVNGPQVVIVSAAFWRDRLGGRADAVGSVLEVGGKPHEIIGIAAPGFAFPENVRLWLPLQNDDEGCGRGCVISRGVARLAEGATLAQAQSELSTLGTRLEREYPRSNANTTLRAAPLRDAIVGDTRTAIFVLLGAVAMVLLIACANVANLVLVTGDARRTEIAVRAAIGADRARIVRQLMTENVLLALIGGGAGLLLGTWSLAGLKAFAPQDLPRLAEIGIDGRVLLFAVGIVLVTTLLFGLAPALRMTGASSLEALRHGRGSGGERGANRFRSTLVMAEVALSVMLLLGAVLMVRSLERMRDVELGIDTSNVVQFRLTLPESRYTTPEAALAFVRQLDERLERIPGVERASAIIGIPFTTMNIHSGFKRTDLPEPEPGTGPQANYRVFDPDALDVLGIELMRGRAFTSADRWNAEPVAMINEAAARLYWPGEDPIGKQMDLSVSLGYPDTLPRTIVGITADFRRTVTEVPVPEMYVPYEQAGADFPQIALRYRGTNPAAVLAAAQTEVQSLDAALPLARPATLASLVRQDMATPTFSRLLLSVFAVLAVGLAAVGLYGVVAYLASRRTREIGIRMAMGARAGEIVRLTVWQGARPALVGAAAGLGGALVIGRYLRSILFETAPTDPFSIAATITLLLAVVCIATAAPAIRATRTPPSDALRRTG